MRRAAIIIATLALGLAACGDDNDTSGTETKDLTPAAGDANRYCALVRELDADGKTIFGRLGRDASPQEYAAAELRFIERYGPKLEELRRAAPQQIRADVGTVLGAQSQRADLKSPIQISESESSAAEKRVRAWEKRNCDA